MSDIRSILEERGKRYGSFEDHALISQALRGVTLTHSDGRLLMKPFQKEAIDMILHKIARILNGDPDYIDSWADIGGYAQLVVDILEKNKANDVRSE